MQDEQRGHTPGEGTHTFHSLSGVRYQGGAHREAIVLQNLQVKKKSLVICHLPFLICHLGRPVSSCKL